MSSVGVSGQKGSNDPNFPCGFLNCLPTKIKVCPGAMVYIISFVMRCIPDVHHNTPCVEYLPTHLP